MYSINIIIRNPKIHAGARTKDYCYSLQNALLFKQINIALIFFININVLSI